MREYPGSEVVPFRLVPRVISAFKMAGGQFIAIVGREMFVGEIIDDLPDQLRNILAKIARITRMARLAHMARMTRMTRMTRILTWQTLSGGLDRSPTAFDQS